MLSFWYNWIGFWFLVVAGTSIFLNVVELLSGSYYSGTAPGKGTRSTEGYAVVFGTLITLGTFLVTHRGCGG